MVIWSNILVIIAELTIPNSVTSIDTKAFYNCDSLTIITIPNSVTNICSEAFFDCSTLTTVYIERPSSSGITIAGEYAFCYYSTNFKIFVSNAESVTAYKAADYWSDYADIIYVKP